MLSLTLSYNWLVMWDLYSFIYYELILSLVNVESSTHSFTLILANSCVELYVHRWFDNGWPDKSRKFSKPI